MMPELWGVGLGHLEDLAPDVPKMTPLLVGLTLCPSAG